MKKETIVIVDGYSFVFRAYHSMPALSRPSDGTPVGAVYGFISMLMRLLIDMKPTHIIVVFDAGGKNFRHEIYPEYKANRPPAPEDLIPQFPLVKEAAKALNIYTIEQKGFEADDIIATLALSARKNQEEVLIISSDKDLMQLVNGHTKMYDAIRSKIIDTAQVEEKFGVKPDKIRDLLALVGDTSDNVPGVPGIGPKTAAELLNTFGDAETLLKNLDSIKQPKRRQMLEEFKDKIKLSQDLVSLKSDLTLDITFDDLKAKKIDSSTLLNFLSAQGFKSLIERAKKNFDMTEESANLAEKESAVNKKAFSHDNIKIIYDSKGLKDICNKASYYGKIAFYFQSNFTQSDEVKTPKDIDSISITIETHHYYIPIMYEKDAQSSFLEEKKAMPFAEFIKGLEMILLDDSVIKIFHDHKRFLHLIDGIASLDDSIDDVMMMSYDLGSGRNNTSYNQLIEFYLEEEDKILDGGITKALQRLNSFSDKEKIAYVAKKSHYIYEVHQILQELLFDYNQQDFYQKIDRHLSKIVYKMETAGFQVDQKILLDLAQELDSKIDITSKEIYKIAGTEFNIASPQQLADILFHRLKIEPPKKSKTGSYSTGVDILEDLQSQGHTIADSIIEWRKLYKLKTTYTTTLVNQIKKKTGRIHTNFLIANTATGRFSSTEPNLQNIPARGEFANKIRSAFRAPEGYKILSFDYSQIELRLLAHVGNIKSMKEAFINKQDIHTITASEVFGVEIKDMTSEIRNKAKAINFGIIYGISAFGLAKNLGISRTEASAYITKYFEQYPGILEYMERCKSFARQHGYVETIMGRKCYVPNINSKDSVIRSFAERAAINFPLQGGNSDIIRKAMIEVAKYIRSGKIDGKLILQVHDELLLEVKNEDIEAAHKAITYIMENVITLDIPIVVGFSHGDSWVKN